MEHTLCAYGTAKRRLERSLQPTPGSPFFVCLLSCPHIFWVVQPAALDGDGCYQGREGDVDGHIY